MGAGCCGRRPAGRSGVVVANALGWVVTFEADDEFEIRPNPERLPGLPFVAVGELRATKNRLQAIPGLG